MMSGQVNLQDSLAAYYPLNGNAGDSSGNANNGTVGKAVSIEDRNGKSGGAFFFNPNNSAYISGMTDKNLPAGAAPRTLCAWIKPYSPGADGYVIVDYGVLSKNSRIALELKNGKINLSFWSNDLYGHIDLMDSAWHHITGIWDGADARIYVDGVLDTSKTYSLIPNTIRSNSLTIGVANNKLWHLYHGCIDEVRIYSRALNDNEIAALASGSTTNVEPDRLNALTAPAQYHLYQNYPNPFNPATKIKFTLPQSAQTKLTVYDILGREVRTLIDQELIAGYHEINFNASNISGGVYFYRIQASNYTETKKCILLK